MEQWKTNNRQNVLKIVKIQSSGRSCRELSQSGMKSSLSQSCNNQDSAIFMWDKQLEWGNKIESPGPNPLIHGRLIYLCLPIHSDMGRTPITYQVLYKEVSNERGGKNRWKSVALSVISFGVCWAEEWHDLIYDFERSPKASALWQPVCMFSRGYVRCNITVT